MKRRILVIWQNKEDCEKWNKERGYEGWSLGKSIENSMKYGNFLFVDRVKDMVKRFDIKVIGDLYV